MRFWNIIIVISVLLQVIVSIKLFLQVNKTPVNNFSFPRLQMAMPQLLDKGSFSDRYYSQQDHIRRERVLQNRERYTVPTGQGIKEDMFE